MSQSQLHDTTSSSLTGRQRWPLIVPGLFTLSFLLVIYMVVAVSLFGMNMSAVAQWVLLTSDVQHTLSIVAWVLSVPLAAILAGVGAAIAARVPTRRLWLMIGVPVLAVGAPLTVGYFAGGLAGSWPPLVFGVGGVLIITLVLLTCWFWAQERPKLRPAQRLGADLRLIAYVLFGLAAWFTCGLASQAVIFGRPPNLTSLLYSILADLVLGWGFMLTGHVLASRAAGSDDSGGEVESAASSG